MKRLLRPALGSVVIALTIALSFAVPGTAAPADAATIRVPANFPTIQAAVDAASAGDTIRVSPGTYTEQLSIGKDLTLVGSGAGKTIVRAPATLASGQDGDSSIVEIHSAASVAISRLTISGPGSGTCEAGALQNGLLVLPDGHLDLSYAAVVDIHDSTLADCFHSGTGVLVFFATANIRYSLVRNYQSSGIVVVGGAGTVTNNVVTGPGRTTAAATSGIEFVAGATGTISNNIVSGNQCGSSDLGCGPDFFNEVQEAGIGGGGPGTLIARNLLFNNQVGIYVGEFAELRGNVLLNNDYVGVALQDGQFTSTNDRVFGGEVGVAVIAAFADTTATLNSIAIAGTAGSAVQKFECCGFTATVIGGP